MSEVKTELFDVENYLALMNLYRDEWKYRDQWFISTFWRMVYLSLIISFLPNFLAAFSVESELVTKLPVWVFSVLGILCALFGLYIMIVENKIITKKITTQSTLFVRNLAGDFFIFSTRYFSGSSFSSTL